MPTVLVLDDETLILMFLEDVLAELDLTVVACANVEDALRRIEAGGFDVAILDVNLGGGRDSFDVARRLMSEGVPFAFATGYGVSPNQQEFGVRPLLAKPFDSDRVAEVVGELLARG